MPLGRERSHRALEQGLVRREQLAGAREAQALQATFVKVGFCQRHGKRISVRVAGDLAQEPIATPSISQQQRRSQLGGRKVGKRKRQQDYLPACKWAHAASSSLRDQSAANAGSLKAAPHKAVSAERGSPVKVTNTRRGTSALAAVSSRKCNFPLGCSTASKVCNMVEFLLGRKIAYTAKDDLR
jgi:hypothetical protein